MINLYTNSELKHSVGIQLTTHFSQQKCEKNFDTRTTKYVGRKNKVLFFCFQFEILLINHNANSEFKHSVSIQLTTHFSQQKCEKTSQLEQQKI